MPPSSVQSNQSSGQQLGARENSQFKRLVKFHEQKQYKKGLTLCRDILKKYPNHGETLAMKGLILNSMGKKTEALEHIRNGIKNHITSHIVWHAYGSWHRSDHKYDEAIKAYKKALQFDKTGQDSLNILRDLSMLQLQMRDLEGYKETCHQQFNLKPGQRQSWLGFVLSHHLLGEYDIAQSILEEFRKTLLHRPPPSSTNTFDNEYSELLLYQNLLLRESQQYDEALHHLDIYEKSIYNKLILTEIRYDLYSHLKINDRAEQFARILIERNTENKNYYLMLEKSLNLSTIDEKRKLYDNLIEQYPKADAPKQICLQFLTGEDFQNAIRLYLQRGFQKGIPSLFQSIKYLYSSPDKIQIIDSVLRDYLTTLERSTDFKVEPPSTLLWLQYYLAQHYDHLGDHNQAFHYIDQAIQDTPTLVELYMFKAKMFKHVGDHQTAANCMNEAQSLDTADRFVNSKCTKYFLRANQIDSAMEMIGKFTRENTLPMDYLREMQCLWFEVEIARTYYRLKKYGEALKKCHEIDRHFQEFIEDQFDFHSYSLRKMAVCAYVNMLNLEAHIKDHKFFRQTAEIAIEIYIHLFDYPLSQRANLQSNHPTNVLNSEDRKLKNKLRKQQIREQQKQNENHQRHKSKDENDEEKIKENEFIPEKLEQVEKPLDEAMKFLQALENYSPQVFQTNFLGFEIYFRKKKFLLMLRCLKRMKKLDETNPKIHSCLMKFLYSMKNEMNFDEQIRNFIDDELRDFNLDLNRNIEQINDEFIRMNSNSLAHRIQAAKVMYLLDPTNNLHAIEYLTKLDSNFADQTLQYCSIIYDNLQTGVYGFVAPSIIETYRLNCLDLWPQANCFRCDTRNS